MPKKKKYRQKTKGKNVTQVVKAIKKNIQDTVIFMTAYDVYKFKRNITVFRQKPNKKELFHKFHITGMSNDKLYVSADTKCGYSVEYDSLKRVTAFYFDEAFGEEKEKNPKFVEDIVFTLSHHHSANALLDSNQVEISMCFKLESFLVKFGTKILQVDSGAFFMNGSLIVYYELIDFETAIPLGREAIYGRNNNYNIKSIDQIRYFDECEFIADDRKISDVIFQNIFGCLTEMSRNKWEMDDYSYVHNTLVLSNEIDDVQSYFQKVLGAQIENFRVDNLATSDDFSYYSTEYLGVVTAITNDDTGNILRDCLGLEAFKTFLLIKMIVNFEVNHNLGKIVNSQLGVEGLFYPSHVPIITLNVLNNLRETVSFSRYKQAIEFKIQAQNIRRERQRISNGIIMNILLYVLAVLGCVQTLQVLKDEFGLPFKSAFWIVVAVFGGLGAVWVAREFINRK